MGSEGVRSDGEKGWCTPMKERGIKNKERGARTWPYRKRGTTPARWCWGCKSFRGYAAGLGTVRDLSSGGEDSLCWDRLHAVLDKGVEFNVDEAISHIRVLDQRIGGDKNVPI